MFFSGKHVRLTSVLPSAWSMAVKLHIFTVCRVAVPSDGNGRANAAVLLGACLLNACSKAAEVNGNWHRRVLDKLCLCPTQRSGVLLRAADWISSAKVGVKQRYKHLQNYGRLFSQGTFLFPSLETLNSNACPFTHFESYQYNDTKGTEKSVVKYAAL